MQILQMLMYFIVQFKEITIVSITIDHIRKIFTYWEVVKFTVKTSFPKFNFHVKAWRLSLATGIVSGFPAVTFSLPCREVSAKHPSPHKEFVSCSFKWKWYSVNVVTNLAHNSNNHTNLVLEISNHHNLAYSWSTSHSVTQVKKICTQGSRGNTNNFSCIINDIF